jgi:hypothetical protein
MSITSLFIRIVQIRFFRQVIDNASEECSEKVASLPCQVTSTVVTAILVVPQTAVFTNDITNNTVG